MLFRGFLYKIVTYLIILSYISAFVMRKGLLLICVIKR